MNMQTTITDQIKAVNAARVYFERYVATQGIGEVIKALNDAASTLAAINIDKARMYAMNVEDELGLTAEEVEEWYKWADLNLPPWNPGWKP